MPFTLDVTSALIGALVGLLSGGGLVLAMAGREIRREVGALSAERAGLAARLEERSRIERALRDDLRDRDFTVAELRRELADLSAHCGELGATLEQERNTAAEKLALLDEARVTLTDTFRALSADALDRNNSSFLDLARQALATDRAKADGELDGRQRAIGELVDPVRRSLERMDGEIRALERSRIGAYESLRQQMCSLAESHASLRAETGNLVRALRTPSARGRWGEMQLRRVVEMAGMVDHCDFFEQATLGAANDGDSRLRPDMVVRLPGGKTVVVDAKTPLEGYLDAMGAEDDATRRDGLARHARHVREHVRQLGAKAYWSRLDASPEFVVLFLPGENFFSAALEHDPSLIEAGVETGVVLATPTTLIALLRSVAYGWRQERMTENARKVAGLGAELYDRLGTLAGHMDQLGANLERAMVGYNRAVGSLETRVLVTARQFRDLQVTPAGADEIAALESRDVAPRRLQAPELRDGASRTPDRSFSVAGSASS